MNEVILKGLQQIAHEQLSRLIKLRDDNYDYYEKSGTKEDAEFYRGQAGGCDYGIEAIGTIQSALEELGEL
jgi:hypothetical protein